VINGGEASREARGHHFSHSPLFRPPDGASKFGWFQTKVTGDQFVFFIWDLFVQAAAAFFLSVLFFFGKEPFPASVFR
jgi:hypothetical protein